MATLNPTKLRDIYSNLCRFLKSGRKSQIHIFFHETLTLFAPHHTILQSVFNICLLGNFCVPRPVPTTEDTTVIRK
jgi:hypothetical protein